MKRVLFTTLVLCLPSAIQATEPADPALLHQTLHFSFFSDFDTNLHDALLISGGMDSRQRTDWFSDGEQLECLQSLPNSVQTGWELAVRYYERVISPNPWGARQQSLVRLDLMNFSSGRDDSARQFNEMARHARGLAAPAYRACIWPSQDARNRAWVARLQPQLERHEDAIARRLAGLYGVAWHGLPLRIDLVADAPPLGANSIVLSPAGGHLLISSNVADEDALEITFHEASHTIVSAWRKDPVPALIETHAAELEMEVPRDLWHVIMFYLTGAAVAESLAASGETDYQPYMLRHGLWNGGWGRYREALEAILPAYLEGDLSLEQAIRASLERFGSEPG